MMLMLDLNEAMDQLSVAVYVGVIISGREHYTLTMVKEGRVVKRTWKKQDDEEDVKVAWSRQGSHR